MSLRLALSPGWSYTRLGVGAGHTQVKVARGSGGARRGECPETVGGDAGGEGLAGKTLRAEGTSASSRTGLVAAGADDRAC